MLVLRAPRVRTISSIGATPPTAALRARQVRPRPLTVQPREATALPLHLPASRVLPALMASTARHALLGLCLWEAMSASAPSASRALSHGMRMPPRSAWIARRGLTCLSLARRL